MGNLVKSNEQTRRNVKSGRSKPLPHKKFVKRFSFTDGIEQRDVADVFFYTPIE